MLAARERTPHGLHPFYPNVGGLAEVPFAKALTRIRPAGSHGVHNSGPRKPLEVITVERKNMSYAGNVHGGNEPSVVALLPRNAMGGDELLPFAVNRVSVIREP